MAECSTLTAPNDTEHTSDAVMWFRSGWNYTLRAEPPLSESGPCEGKDRTVGVSALGRRAEQRGSKGRRQIPSWKSGTGSFCLSRHIWAFVSLFVHSLIYSSIHSARQSVTQEMLRSVQLCSLA